MASPNITIVGLPSRPKNAPDVPSSPFAEAGSYYLFTVFLLSHVATTLKFWPATPGRGEDQIGAVRLRHSIPDLRLGREQKNMQAAV